MDRQDQYRFAYWQMMRQQSMKSALLQQLNYGCQKAGCGRKPALKIYLKLGDYVNNAAFASSMKSDSTGMFFEYDQSSKNASSTLARLLSIVPECDEGHEFVKWIDTSTGEDLTVDTVLTENSVLSAVTKDSIKTWSSITLPEQVTKSGLTTWTYYNQMQKVVPGGNPGHFVCVYTGNNEDCKLIDFQYVDQTSYTFTASPYVSEVGSTVLKGTSITAITNLTQISSATNLQTSNMITRGVTWADDGSKLIVNYNYSSKLLTYNVAESYVLSSVDVSKCSLVALGSDDSDGRDSTVYLQFSTDGKKFFKFYSKYAPYSWYKLSCTSISAYALQEPWELSSALSTPDVYVMGQGGKSAWTQICDKPLFGIAMSLDGKSLIGCYRSNAAHKALAKEVLKLVKIDFEEGWDLSKPVRQQECTVVDDVSYTMPLYADISPDGSHIVYAYGSSSIVFVSVPIT